MSGLLAVGQRIQRFEITGLLGVGGMGAVYRARDTQLQRDVAIKLVAKPTNAVRDQLAATQTLDLRTRVSPRTDDILHEAQMMARLSHPNVLPVYEVGLVDGAVLLVMECVEGTDLGTWLRTQRAPSEVLAAFAQTARGLCAAHACGVVHGDFKPENVLVGSDGRVRVADFGLSRIVAERSEMVRVGDVGGTPHYMAPELWRGEPATQASDVFAFSVALTEALGEAVPLRLRELLAAGVEKDPQRRPALGAIAAALEPPPRRRAVLIAAAAAGALAAGAVTTIFVVRSAGADAAACPPTVSPASGRWDDAKRAALRTALAAQGHDRLERIVANFDELQRDIDDHWEATCKAVRSGALTADQANQRRSCLERREIELGVKVDHFIRAKPNEPTLVERAQVFNVAACDELALPPLPTDREPVIALYRKLIATEDMRTPDRIAPVQEIERAAAVLGERELEMRAMLLAGIWQSDSGQLAAAEESLKRAYQASVDRRSVLVQTVALTMRARVADLKGEAREAMSFASLARELADRPTTPTAARARVYYQLAHAAIDRGEAAAATEYVKRALEIVHQDRHPLPFVEAGIRIDTVRALGMYEGHKREAIAAAREGVAWMKQAFGEHSVNHAKMLGQLASALRWNNEIVEALAIYRRSVALMIESSPPGDPSILLAKGDLARHLEANGLFEEARELWAEELAAAPHNEMVRAYLPLITVRLGVSTCAVGRCAEGYPQIERGLELGIAQYGGDHKNVVEYRDALLDAQLELGKLDDAERNLAVMERIWTKDAQRHARSLAMLNGWARARILIDRKRPAAAEKLTRTALATWQELRGDDGPHAALAYALGLALLEQRRYAEARTALEESARLAASAQQREDFFAELEVALARVDAATGARLRARERAARAREVLARYPMSLHARRDLARLR